MGVAGSTEVRDQSVLVSPCIPACETRSSSGSPVIT